MMSWRIYFVLLFYLLQFSSCTDRKENSSNNKASASETYIIDSLINRGNILKIELNYHEALESYISAFENAKKNPDLNYQFLIQTRIAELYRSKGQFSEAKEHLQKASKIMTQSGAIDDTNKMLFYNRSAAIWNEYHRNVDSTIIYSNKALSIAKKKKDSNNIFISTMEIGAALEKKNDLDSALAYFNTALKYAKLNSNRQLVCDASTNICRVELKKNDLESAFKTATFGYELAVKNNFLFSHLVFADYLKKIFKKQGNLPMAFKYGEESSQLKDYYFNKRYDEKTIETTKRLRISERENELRLSREELNQAILRKRTVQIVLMLTIGLLFIIIYSWIRIRKQNKKLHHFNEENKFLVAETNHRVNNNLQLISIFIQEQINKNQVKENEGLSIVSKQVDTLSLLHRHLYQSNDRRMIELNDYLHSIISSYSFLKLERDIHFDLDITFSSIPVEKGMYVGLLVNELITNSIKHALCPVSKGLITIAAREIESTLEVEYFDNGKCNIENSKPATIDKICRQLGAKYQIDFKPNCHFKASINL